MPKKLTQFFKGFSLSFFTILFVITGCASHKASTYPDSQPTHKIKEYADFYGIEKKIRDEFKRWKGTRHRLGGTGHGGIDCSGFVKKVYKKGQRLGVSISNHLPMSKSNVA